MKMEILYGTNVGIISSYYRNVLFDVFDGGDSVFHLIL